MIYLLFVGIFIWLFILSNRIGALNQKLDALQPATKDTSPHSSAPGVFQAQPERPQTTPLPIKKPNGTTKSLEERIGLQWFQWLGIAALIVALIFFLKWSFENGWIGPVGRIVGGYLLAGGAMAAGEFFRTKYGKWSLAFTGGGALASYIVTWIALHVYHLFPSTFALVIYTLTTLVTCLLSGYYRAIPLAVFGIIGGFLTPILSGGGGSITGLLSYILILDLGVLALGHARQWRVLNAIAFIGTLLWEFYALAEGGIARENALLFMAAFGVIYLLIPAMYNILRKLKSEPGDLLLLIGNGLAHFWLLLQWLEKTPGLREKFDAPIALGFSMLFFLVSAGIYEKNKKDTPLVLTGLSLTVLFATIAIPLQLGGVWISLTWSLEASLLLCMALWLRDKRIQLFAWPVMGAAYFWYLAIPSGDTVIALQETGFWLFLFWAILFAALASLALRGKEGKTYLLPFALIGVIALVLILSFNVVQDARSSLTFLQRFCEAAAIMGGSYLVLFQAKLRWRELTSEEKTGFSILGIGVQIITLAYITYEYVRAIDEKKIFSTVQRSRDIQQVGISILWATYAIITLVIGFLKQWKMLRIFSSILLLIAVAKLSVVDLFHLGTGYRILGFTVLGALLVGASFLYQRNKEQLKKFFVNSSTDSSPSAS